MTAYDPEHVATAVLVIKRRGRILLLQRGRTDPWMPGKWCLPGGAVDRGEGPFEAAIREAYEEAGLDLQVQDILPVDVIELDTTTVYVFTAEAPGQQVRLLDGEHSDFHWAGKDEIHSFRTIPLVKPIIRSLSHGRSRSSSKTRTFRA